tara:strand:- start:171 stop:395 length:225 start_codon:yes stop_codon:yes gene_type:complete
MTTTLVPAYGRDYGSKRAVEKALKGQFDFIIKDVSSKWDGKYACLYDLKREGHKDVKVRYSNLRKICIFELEEL